MEKKELIKEKQRPGRKKIIIAVIIILLVIGTVIVINYFKSDAGTPKNASEKNMLKDSSIPFNKQGELTFISAKGKIISGIDIELADNESAHAMGLMFRTKMEEKQGMLFIFQTEEEHSFWMKNTIIPLDIIFLNAKKEIIKIHKSTAPYQEEPGYESGKPAMYVIEVNAGYCDKFNIEEGCKINFTRF